MTEIIQRERRPEILELMAPQSVRLRFPSGEFFRLICLPGAVESGGKSLLDCVEAGAAGRSPGLVPSPTPPLPGTALCTEPGYGAWVLPGPSHSPEPGGGWQAPGRGGKAISWR